MKNYIGFVNDHSLSMRIPKHGGMPYVGSYPVRLFSSREDARKYGRAHSKRAMDLKTDFINASKSNIPDSARWFVFEK